MKAIHAALFALLALSAIFNPFLSAGSTEPAGIPQGDSCSESGDSESLDQDEPDQDQMYDEDDPIYDEADDYDSYGEKEGEEEEKEPAD